MSEPLQVSAEEAAKMLSFSVRTIQRMAESGDIIATGSGRLTRYDVQSIREKQARMRDGEPPIWRVGKERGKSPQHLHPKMTNLLLHLSRYRDMLHTSEAINTESAKQ